MRSALCAGGSGSVALIGGIALLGCISPVDSPDSLAEQAATVCAAGATIRGIDVSYYETSVDWVAAHAAGIDFAFIRVTDGTQFIDPKFPGYWAGAKAAGVIRGAYQFFRPAEDPVAQADLLLDRMGPLEPGDLPPVIDVEVSGGLSTAQVAASVSAWVDHVAAAIGRPPIIYAGLYSWHDLTGSADLTTSPLWIAQYTSAPCPDIPAPWPRWLFWQTSATGTVAGIPGATLDLDVFDGSIDDLRRFGTGAPPETHATPVFDHVARVPDDPSAAATATAGGCETSRGAGAGAWLVLAAWLAGQRRRDGAAPRSRRRPQRAPATCRTSTSLSPRIAA